MKRLVLLLLILGLSISVLIISYNSTPHGNFRAIVSISQNSTQAAVTQSVSENNLLILNRMRKLEGNEFLVLRDEKKEAPTSGTINARFALKNGLTYSLPLNRPGSATLIQGDDNVATYVKSATDDVFHNVAELDSSKGKVSPVFLRRLEGGKKASVIIQFDLPTKFYESGKTRAEILDKQNRFNQTKSQVVALASSGLFRYKGDLKIVNGIAAEVDRTALEALASSPLVKKVEEERTYHLVLDTSVDEIGARQVWSLFDANSNPLTGIGMRVAVIDTGVDYRHPDLGGCLGISCKVIGGYDFVNQDQDPMDDHGHGTHVAATAAGRGFLNGVAPDAKILALKVCDSGGSCPFLSIAAAIDFATDPDRDGNPQDHVDVATMSIGGSGDPDDFMSLAVDNSVAAGVVHTIAAGNSGPNGNTACRSANDSTGATKSICSPGTARSAITVTAACKVAQRGNDFYCATPIASFSSRGPLIWNGVDLRKPDIAAPGRLICAARWDSAFADTCFDASHVRISGTSMATPHVAGAALLVRQAYPSFSPAQVKEILKTTATNLGVSYNEQGAGEVNLTGAIPLSVLVNVTPQVWGITSNPAGRLSLHAQTFSATPVDPSIATLRVNLPTDIPGVSFASDKSLLQVAGRTTDSFRVTATVDNDQARSGAYLTRILLTENNVTKAVIQLNVVVSPTFTVSPDNIIDYGFDDPLLATWTSTQRVTLANLRQDQGQTVTITASAYPAGITFSAPPSVTIPAGGSAAIDTSITVDNAHVPNTIYNGSLTFTSSFSSVTRATRFLKAYRLVFVDENNTSFINAVIYVHDRTNRRFILNHDVEKILYLDAPGNFDAIVLYDSILSSTNLSSATVFKENISVTQATTIVPVRRSDATYLVRTIGTNLGGETVSLSALEEYMNYIPARNLFNILFVSYSPGREVSANYFSPVSSNYQTDDFTYWPPVQANATQYVFYGGFTSLTNALTFTNTPTDIKAKNIRYDMNFVGPVMPALLICNETICASGFYDASRTLVIPSPGVQQIYSTVPSEFSITQYLDQLRSGCPPSGACPSIFLSPLFSMSTNRRWAGSSGAAFEFPPVTSGTQYNGLGPTFWAGKLTASYNFLVSPYHSGVSGNSVIYWHNLLLRQDFSAQDYEAIPYTLYKDNVQVASGSFPRYRVLGYSSAPDFIPFQGLGHYELRVDFPYQVRGSGMTGQAVLAFNNSLPDPNPPAIKKLYFYSDRARSEAYDPAMSNRVVAEFDPIGGNIGNVAMSYSTDGATFTPFSVVRSPSGEYTGTIPQVVGGSLMNIRLEATDSSNNTLSYTFQVPIGAATPLPPPLPNDRESPAVSIVSPLDTARISRTVTVAVLATDNVDVARVELWKDSSLFMTDSVPPYTFDWDTTANSDGPHTLEARAFDDAGNAGRSAVVNVKVNNEVTSPKVVITTPTDSSKLPSTGVVSISAAAEDSSGIASIEILFDGVTLAKCQNVTSCTTSLKVAPLSPGSHFITAIAHDASPNQNEAKVKITVFR